MTPARLDQRPTHTTDGFRFEPLVAGALYPGIERGLSADVIATRALGGRALVVCTSLVVAGGGRVTDVLDVPADTVGAQAAHLFATERPTGACVGLAGNAAAAHALVQALGQHLQGPLVLNLTLSGPSGEDVADARVRDLLVRSFPLADVVVVGLADAELVVGMEIHTLDDAQVAVQRFAQRGARAVLLRCGALPAHEGDEAAPFTANLLFDGEAFALFEAPLLDRPQLHGARSAFALALLRARVAGEPFESAAQFATQYVSEVLRASAPGAVAPDYPLTSALPQTPHVAR